MAVSLPQTELWCAHRACANEQSLTCHERTDQIQHRREPHHTVSYHFNATQRHFTMPATETSEIRANSIPLPNEILLMICNSLVLMESQELYEIVKQDHMLAYSRNDTEKPLYTAYRSLLALARTCRALHPLATDPQVVNMRAVWPFNHPIAAFTRQATLERTLHIDIIKACSEKREPRSQGRTRDEIKHDVDQMPPESWPEDVQKLWMRILLKSNSPLLFQKPPT